MPPYQPASTNLPGLPADENTDFPISCALKFRLESSQQKKKTGASLNSMDPTDYEPHARIPSSSHMNYWQSCMKLNFHKIVTEAQHSQYSISH
jgi:hypothetical protein